MNKSWLSAGILPVVMMFAACNARLTRADLERRLAEAAAGEPGLFRRQYHEADRPDAPGVRLPGLRDVHGLYCGVL